MGALLDGDIKAILLDAYTAGDYRDILYHPQVRNNEVIKLRRSYGFCVAGSLQNAANQMKLFVQENEKEIMEFIKNNTYMMEVRMNVKSS